MKVKEIMHSGVAWVDPSEPLASVATRMRKDDIGSVPVGENDRLIGMVTDRDIALRGFADGKDPLQMTARDVMSEGIVYCLEDEEIDDAVRLMEDRRMRRLPVLNKGKRMVGMISIGDVAARAPASLSAEMLRAVSAHHA